MFWNKKQKSSVPSQPDNPGISRYFGNDPASVIQMLKTGPRSLTREQVIYLQQTIGNQAVCQLLKNAGIMNDVKSGNEKKTISKDKTDEIRSRMENISGVDLSDVRVHFDSGKPAELGALAFTKGTEIHIGPGQEKHLPHEMWHAVQQKQGRVRPTRDIKGIRINDDKKLEKEADKMGQKNISDKKIDITKKAAAQKTVQMKPGTLNMEVKVMKLSQKVPVTEQVKIVYDDTKPITVQEIKVHLQKEFEEKLDYFTISLIYKFNNPEMSGNLTRPDYSIPGENIAKFYKNVFAVIKEVEGKSQKEEEDKPKDRDPDIITITYLCGLIDTYEFAKIVTGNHINAAKKEELVQDSGVQTQQINEIEGNTLFIDPSFQKPLAEWQYHDQLAKSAGGKYKTLGKLYLIPNGQLVLGVLPMRMYSDEVSEVGKMKGVTIKHYITETRPANIKKVTLDSASSSSGAKDEKKN